MTPRITFEYLATANVFEMIGTISGLLKQLERQTGEECAGEKCSEKYRREAMAAGSHAEAVKISHEYAQRFLQSTLQVGELEEYIEEVQPESYERVRR